MATTWYYALNGERKGPISTEELTTMVANGQLTLNDRIWRKGLAEWIKVAKVRELAVLAQNVTPQAAQASPPPQAVTEVKPSEDYLRLAPDTEEVAKKQQQMQEVAPQPVSPQPVKPQVTTPQVTSAKPATTPKPQAAQWYYARGGKKAGPVTAQFLKEKAQSGQLLPTDLLWKDGLKDWVAASTLPGLKFPAATGQAPQASPTKVQPVVAAPIVTNDPFGTIGPFGIAEPDASPDANSIFDIMNDPSFANAPASSGEKANAGLADLPTAKKKKKKKASDDDYEPTEQDWISAEGSVAILFLVLGVVFTVIAIRHYYSYVVRLRDEGIIVEATVIDVQRVHRRRSLVQDYQPTIRFVTESGQNITIKMSQTRSEVVVGDKYEMVYLPDAPEKADINSGFTYTVFNSWWAAIAIACYLIAAIGGYKWFAGRQKLATASWG